MQKKCYEHLNNKTNIIIFTDAIEKQQVLFGQKKEEMLLYIRLSILLTLFVPIRMKLILMNILKLQKN